MSALDVSHFGILQWLVIAVSAFVIGLSKTGLPGGGVLAIPLAAMAIPAKASTGLILPMLIMGDVFAVLYYRRHADWGRLGSLLPWAALGIVAGYFILGFLSDAQLRPVIGVVILAMLLMNRWKAMRSASEAPPAPTNVFFAPSMGTLGGAVTMMANAAGPVVSLYLLAMRLPKAVFVGTAAWFFMIVNLFKVPFSAHLGLINAHSLAMNALMFPLVALGAYCGIRLLKRIPEALFNRLVLILAAIAAIKLLF